MAAFLFFFYRVCWFAVVCQFGALLVVIPGSILLYNTLAFPLNDINKILDILENFNEGEKVIIAGRLMRRKIQGKASFGSIQDSKGKIQVYFKDGTLEQIKSYKDGALSKVQFYYNDGSLKQMSDYENGTKSKAQLYLEDGTLDQIRFFIDGEYKYTTKP